MRLPPRAKVAARAALHRAGFDLVRSLDASDLLRRRLQLIEQHRISVLFDVGANAGQYASTMRALGYTGKIVSFEPSARAFSQLSSATRGDPHWTAVRCALGDHEGDETLHISANSQSSSLLAMLPAHLAADPGSAYTEDETVTLTTLAAQIERHVGAEDRLFVKVDTQGSEREVIVGAGEALDVIAGWQVELSMVPLYDGQPVMEEIVALLRGHGYAPMSLEPDFFNPSTGQLLQADGIFFRSAGAVSQGPLGPR